MIPTSDQIQEGSVSWGAHADLRGTHDNIGNQKPAVAI